MDISEIAIGGRESALLTGDYQSYHRHLSQQLLSARRRLGRTTKKNAKYAKAVPITSENIKQSKDYVQLILFSAERAWAHAMRIKASHAEETTGRPVTGPPRQHIISRLSTAVKHAQLLGGLLKDRETSGSSDGDILAARAYLASLTGALHFEKQVEGQHARQVGAKPDAWHACLKEYAVARVIYAALLKQTNKDLYKDFVNNTIDPTIRYASYQAKLPRTISVGSAALKFFPTEDTQVADLVKAIDPEAFVEHKPVKDPEVAVATGEAPSSIRWRGRTAAIADASIGQALANVGQAEKKLEEFLEANADAHPKKKANAYDDILIAYQDATDANRHAIDEVEKEGLDEGDSRMQDLRVSSLAINYDLVSWRIGRNRVLIGADDGLTFGEPQSKNAKRQKKSGKIVSEQGESQSKKLSKLKERLVLYDLTIQSIDAVKSLRGAMRDTAFVAELDGRRAYFQSLKCLTIAISHSLLSNHLNALALLSRAADLAKQAQSSIPATTRSEASAPTIEISSAQLQDLQRHITAQLSRHQALAEMSKLEEQAASAVAKNKIVSAPLIERINDYPVPGVQIDLKNLVAYPPKLEPVPVKPLFFDVAFNYLEYPGQAKKAVTQAAPEPVRDEVMGSAPATPAAEEKKGRGWFGFGRS